MPFVEAASGQRLRMTQKYFEGWSFGGSDLARLGLQLLRQGRVEDAQAFVDAAAEAGEDVGRLDRLVVTVQELDDEPVVIANEDTKEDELYAKAVLDMTNGDDRNALARFDAVDDSETRSLAHRFLYAYLCYRAGRLGDAEYLIRDVMQDEIFVAQHPTTLYYAGRIAMYSGDFEEGIAYLERFDDSRLSEQAALR